MINVEMKIEITCDLCGVTITSNSNLDDDNSIVDVESKCEALAWQHGYDYEAGDTIVICSECSEKLWPSD